MGIELDYVRLSPQHCQSLLDDEDTADEFFYGDERLEGIVSIYSSAEPTPETTRLSLEKDWDMMHFLYTGRSSFEEGALETPLHNVVQGGSETPFESTHGKVRLLAPKQVLECAKALEALAESDLRCRFQERGERDIYPGAQSWTGDEEQNLLAAHRHLLLFFQEAARAGECVLISS